MTNTDMEARLTEDLGEQTLAHIIISAEKLGMEFMGDQMIGFKLVGGTRESRRVWNLIIGKVIPDGFEFTDEFFECYGIQPIPYESQKWNEQYETRF